MQLNKFDIFPTEIISFQFNTEEIQPLIDEISKNKKKIKQISDFYNNVGGVGKYYTDYENPTKLHEYEKLMMMIGNYFINNKKTFNIQNYWSAIYFENSIHETHNHVNFIKEKTHNYSTVLYLSNIGGTKFFSSNNTSLIDDITISSRVGKIIFFPSNLLHSGINNEKGERIIISSNIGIHEQ
jgi:AAA+ ATPase superfamily predicted ATPase